jgi:hypothetical protein
VGGTVHEVQHSDFEQHVVMYGVHADIHCSSSTLQVIERIAAALPQPSPSAAVFVGGLPTADDEKRLRR